MTINSLGLDKAPADTKVCIAMSGGVDSSATAYMLKQEGYDVFGITMDLLQAPYATEKSSISDAGIVAEQLGIPHTYIDIKKDFFKKVVQYFSNTYQSGQTPSPCIMCNKEIKLGILAKKAIDMGADIIVTGHYADIRTTEDGVELFRGSDHEKDQSYFLFAVDKDVLQKLRCPLANYTKEQTREMAKKAGLSIHNKSDSQDICFVQNGKYAELIAQTSPNFQSREGNIINTEGKILGKHKGIIHYTIGQRRGLGVGGGDILYVLNIDAKNNTVVVGSHDELGQSEVLVTDVNWIATTPKPASIDLMVKLRSRQALVSAEVIFNQEDNSAIVKLKEPFYGVAKGQGCCFYNNDQVMGGGFIVK